MVLEVIASYEVLMKGRGQVIDVVGSNMCDVRGGFQVGQGSAINCLARW